MSGKFIMTEGLNSFGFQANTQNVSFDNSQNNQNQFSLSGRTNEFAGFNESKEIGPEFMEIAKGDKGDPGKGFDITGIVESVEELPETAEPYTMYLVGEDVPYIIYTMDNGEWKSLGPFEGPSGDDGYSPTVTVEDIPGGHLVTITDKDGDHEFQVLNGQDGADGTRLFVKTVNISASMTDAVIGTISGDSDIKANMIIVKSSVADYAYQLKKWDVTFSNGGLSVSGRSSAATTLTLILMEG